MEDLRSKFEQHAEANGIKLNPDEKYVAGIIKGLLKREQATGMQICPCRRVTGDAKTDTDNCCPCVHHMREIAEDGQCKCKLFVAKP